MSAYQRYYDSKRQPTNEASRNSAENYKELWSAEDVETLETLWDSTQLIPLAEMLGRTVEACRQKHYELNNPSAPRVKAVKAAQAVDKWSKGFTSLEEMGW